MKRAKFSLSNYKLLSCDMGKLIPCNLLEVLPGDSIQQSTSALVRVSALLAPVMHPVQVRIHHWFVPHRLVWDDWENFITGGPDGMDASVFPTITDNDGVGESSLADYLGIPPGVFSTTVSALPFRAYALIWNEFYRDQDLQTPLVIDKTSGDDTTTNKLLQNIAWEKDYFTSSRPWTQKGPEVTLPLGTSAPVSRVSNAAAWKTYQAGTNSLQTSADVVTDSAGKLGAGADISLDPMAGLIADLSTATSATINDLRRSMAIQRYEEARARYGSRYTEYLRYLGVRSSDARLQRPEYLGGGKQTIQFSEVLVTGTNEFQDAVGTMKGHGIAAMRSNRYRRFFEEHGYVISLISVKPKTMYADGIPKTWNRRTKEEFFQKELQHIGQQEVYTKELYGAVSDPVTIFGYQDRYDEYRRQESTIAGEFRSTLDFWHYARIFGSTPVLNSDFITSVPTKRVNAVTDTHCLYIMANHSIQARRLLSQTGTSFIF